MTVRPEIHFQGFEPSDAVTARVEEKFERLLRVANTISGCRVTIDLPHKHQQKGRHYLVSIEVRMPGGDFNVNRDSPDPDHEDVYVALRDAFKAMERQLVHHVEKVKDHHPRDRNAPSS
mgnify:CR=1 FL=1